MVKVSLAVPPLPSLAVTRISRLPTSPLTGVPLKVRAAASKLSQLGKAGPSAKVAVSARLSPSASVNVFSGTSKLKALSSAID